MMRVLLALLVLLWSATGDAQRSLLLRDPLPAAATSTYTGPGDIVSGAKIWYGLRAYNRAYAQSLGKIANVCTPADAVCADVNSDINGNFNLAGTGSLTCNNSGSICTIKTLYDQSGALSCSGGVACNMTAVAGNRPQLNINVIGSLPAMSTIVQQAAEFRTSSSFTQAQAFTVSVVYDSTTTAVVGMCCAGGGLVQIDPNVSAAGTIQMYAGTALNQTVSNNAFHAAQFMFNGASSLAYVDGSALTTGNAGANGWSADTFNFFGNANGTGNPSIGYGAEFGVWAGAFTGTQQSNMNSNQHTYWGF